MPNNIRRKLAGEIISSKMNHTVIVKVEAVKVHPKYHKRYKVSKKYPAHTDTDEFKMGDKVMIEESRPYSKTVHWKVISKV
ncbi:MAG: 30S ribosomal protein S17 [Candidatus Doudnabacteria bacterium RIFCSPLOWO2_01_FULL_44_21]|uniref:Small ribosomal subunit protein uS17 n=1 Tax=Candidatus Doudnabacteria bacterium RIFCSPLOWO2_01_FULL_44_21 TaxID=1817841 RepID=A0A1F5PYY0_9BACT|nr:ribosomal protein S17 [uncultured bacterium]OGE83554.1 MAG: 30S ribosomal protein S17 [Candidatus Doudnabacteria bacterium RIFCSPHIGHO2_02_FULL_43_13b]OGE94800.1 MAG: 30S ribosomal protein S17 [Candidatus Doudnabacteria bacterium RIFCSPLOWO2_01_FULL_44_21]